MFVRGVVWCCYLVGNSQTQPILNAIAYIDFVGLGLALLMTAYKLFGRNEDF